MSVFRSRAWTLSAAEFSMPAMPGYAIVLGRLPAGTLLRGGAALAIGDRITRQELDAGRVRYVPADDEAVIRDEIGFDMVDESGALVGEPAQIVFMNLVDAAGTPDTGQKSLSGTAQLAVAEGRVVSVSSAEVAVRWNGLSTDVRIDNRGVIESTFAGGRGINASGAVNGERTLTFVNHQGALLQSDNDAFRINIDIARGNVLVENAGTIHSTAGGQAIDFNAVTSAAPGQVTINNLATGVIRSADADAVRPGQGGLVVNAGLIYADAVAAANYDGVDFQASSGIVRNLAGGVIYGRHQGVNGDAFFTVYNEAGGLIVGRNGAGVGGDGKGKVVNYGTIIGSWEGIGAADGDGIDFDDYAEVDNYGTIVGQSAGGLGSDGEPNSADGVVLGGGGYVHNHLGGIITSAFFGISAAQDTLVVNNGYLNGGAYGILAIDARIHNTKTGVIAGNGFALAVVNGAVTFRNDGLIQTWYGLWFQDEAGGSTLVNSGIIAPGSGGAIQFGIHDDTLTIEAGSVIKGTIDGGGGSDTLILAAGAVFNTATGFERLLVEGDASLTGDLAVDDTRIERDATLTMGQGGDAGALVGTVLIDGGTLAIDRSDTVVLRARLSGSGAFEQRGSGTTTIDVATAHSGETRVLAGVLALGADGDLAASSGARVEGVLDLSAHAGPVALAGLRGSGEVRLGATALRLDRAVGEFAGTIAGTGGLVLSGAAAVTLSGTAAWSGGTTIGAEATLVLLGKVRDAGPLRVDGRLEVAGTLALALAGTGTVAHDAGTLALTGSNGFSGRLVLGTGTLALADTGALASTATVDVAAGDAVLQLTGTASLAATIAGFGVGDRIELAGWKAADTTATVRGAGVLLATGTAMLDLALPLADGLRLVVGDDGRGGVMLGVAAGANRSPTGDDGRVTMVEDGRLVLSIADFGYRDADGDAPGAVIVSTLPDAGQLLFDGVAVVRGQVIGAAELAAGRLVFLPTADANGTGYARIGFQLRDNGGTAVVGSGTGTDTDPLVRTLAIDVVSIVDLASAVDDGFTAEENAVLTGNLVANDRDPNGRPFRIVEINGVVVTSGGTIRLPSGASLLIHADGSFVYDPNGRFNALTTAASGATNTAATDRFTYTLAGGTTATVLVRVTGVAGAGDVLEGSVGDDAITGTAEADIVAIAQGGADRVDAGAGDDVVRAGAALDQLDRIRGGTGFDRVEIAGDYAGARRLVLEAATLSAVEQLTLAPGSSYALLIEDRALTANPLLVIDGSALRKADDLWVDASAVTADTLRVRGGLGRDLLIGGAGSDSFLFGPDAWGPDDRVTGGAGTDRLVLDGDYAITLNARAGVETVVLVGGTGARANRYTLTIADDFVGTGETRTIDASAVTTPFFLDVSAARDGRIVVRGGSGADVIVGTSGNDMIDGGTGFDTVVFGDRLTQVTVIRTDAMGLSVTGTGTGIGIGILTNVEALRFADGTVTLKSSNPLIDNLYYSRTYADVLASGLDPAAHYANYGAAEGRNPNAGFSTRGYLAANPDVTAAGRDALAHYAEFGWKEGRDPSAAFDTQLYLLHNPDVARAGINPLEHYLHFGQTQGEQAYAAIGMRIDVNGFDRSYYLLANPDVAAAGMDPWQHYLRFGAAEGRDPNAWFDSNAYLLSNPDVAAAGLNPLQHFHDHGWKEGRDPSAAFDTNAYLAANADVAASGFDPLFHYLQYGALELRSPLGDGVMAHG